MTNPEHPGGRWAYDEAQPDPATVAKVALPAARADGTSGESTSVAWWWVGVATLAVGASVLYLWGIGDGARSEYYAAIAKSMSLSWHNFLFGAMDPAGTVSVDKIPGSFWFMALSVKIFGMSNFAVILPNALASSGTVVVIAHAVRRWVGPAAGLIAGAMFALTPIVAAVARSNQPHVIFVFFLVLAANRAVVAVQTGARRSLVAAGLWIAVAFQCYMLEAWAIWPALIAAWLIGTDLPWRRRLTDLAIAGAISGAVSLSWIVLVSLTPASSRPWVGGSNGNSAFEMVFGYNGLGRFGQSASGGPGFGGIANTATSSTSSYRGFAAPFGGPAGLGRLFNDQVAGQIAWLMPAALLALVVVAVTAFRTRTPIDGRGPAVFFGAWFLIYAAMFSLSSGIHQFYTAALAPAIAALVAAAVVGATRSSHWYGKVGVVVTLLATATYASIITARTAEGYFEWAPLVQLAIAALAIALVWFGPWRLKRVVPFALAAALVFTPAVWAVDVVNHPNSINPTAGPDAGPGGGPGGRGGRPDPGAGLPFGGPRPDDPDRGAGTDRPDMFGGPGFDPNGGASGFGGSNGPRAGANDLNDYSKELVAWLRERREGARFLFATFGSMSAAPYIAATGENVLPIGGFDGADPSPSVAQIAAWVQAGELRYVLTGGQGGGPRGGNAGSQEIRQWVLEHCTAVADAPVDGLVRCSA